jgi:hypothetical protein
MKEVGRDTRVTVCPEIVGRMVLDKRSPFVGMTPSFRPALHAEHLVRSLAGPFGWSVYDKST